MREKNRKRLSGIWKKAFGLLLAAGLVVVASSTAYAQSTIPATLNGDASYTNDSSAGAVTAARSETWTSATDPSFAVTFAGDTALINGNLTIGTIVNNWNDGGTPTPNTGIEYGSVTLEFKATLSTIAGKVENTGFAGNTNAGVTLKVTGGLLVIGGNLVNTNGVGNGLVVSVDNNLGTGGLMVGGDLSQGVSVTGSTLGVAGKIGSATTVNGGTLKIGTATTGLGNVTVTTASGDSSITTYADDKELHFTNESGIPNIILDDNDLTIKTTKGIGNIGGSIMFDNQFALSSTAGSITGSGDLIVQTAGTSKDLTFGGGVDLDFGGNDGSTTLSSSGALSSTGGFSYATATGGTGGLTQNANEIELKGGDTTINLAGGGNLNLTAATTVTLGTDDDTDSTNIIQTGTGATTIEAGTGFTNYGDFTYEGEDGALGITATTGDVEFTGATTITQTGAGATRIISGGSITHDGLFKRDGVDGGLTEEADGSLTLDAGANIDFTGTGDTKLQAGTSFTSGGAFAYNQDSGSTGTGDLEITAQAGDAIFNNTTAITNYGAGATTIMAIAGSITTEGTFSYAGGAGSVLTLGATDFIHQKDDVDITQQDGDTMIMATGNASDAGYITYDEDFKYFGRDGNLTIVTGPLGGTGFEGGGDITFGTDGGGNATTITFTGTGGTQIVTYGTDVGSVIFNSKLAYDADDADGGTAGDFVINAGSDIDFKGNVGIGLNGTQEFDGDIQFTSRGGDINFTGATTEIKQYEAGSTTITALDGSINIDGFTREGDDGDVELKANNDIIIAGDVNITFTDALDDDTGDTILTAQTGAIKLGTDETNSTTITQGGDGATTITAGTSFTNTGSFTYDGKQGEVEITGTSVTFGTDATNATKITQTGAGSTTIQAAAGSITTEGTFSYIGGADSDLTLGATNSIHQKDDVNITQQDGDTIIMATGNASDPGKITYDKDFKYSGRDGELRIGTGSDGGIGGGDITFGTDGGGNATTITFTGTGETQIATIGSTNAGSVIFNSELVYDADAGVDTAGNFSINAGSDIDFKKNVSIGLDTNESNPADKLQFDGDISFTSRGGNINFTGTTTEIKQYEAGSTTIMALDGSINIDGFTRDGDNGNVELKADENLTITGNVEITFTDTDTDGVTGATILTATQGAIKLGTDENNSTTITQGGDGATTITAGTSFANTGNFTYVGEGGAVSITATTGDVIFGTDDTNSTKITQAGTGSTTITATAGSIENIGTFTYTGENGTLGIYAETVGKTITFGGDVKIDFNAGTATGSDSGATEIITANGNIEFDGKFDYIASDYGDLHINAGPDGNIIFNKDVSIDFSGSDGHVFITTKNGQVISHGKYEILAGTGDLFTYAPVTDSGGNIMKHDLNFTAGGGSVFYGADANIYLGNVSNANVLKYDFSAKNSGGLAMVAAKDITIGITASDGTCGAGGVCSDFRYVGNGTAGIAAVPAHAHNDNSITHLRGASVENYGLYMEAQNDGCTTSKITFLGGAELVMNAQKGLIKTPFLHNMDDVLLNTNTGAGVNTKLEIVTDFWALQNDLTIDGTEHVVSSRTIDLNDRSMPVLELLGSNSSSTTIADEQITISYLNDADLEVFSHIIANKATVSFVEDSSTNLRTDLLTVQGESAFNGSAANTSGHIELATASGVNAATGAGIFVNQINLGQQGYKDDAGVAGVPGVIGSGLLPVIGTVGDGGTGATLYVGDALHMDGGILSFESVDSNVVFNNGYVLGAAGGFVPSSNPLTENSYIDWENVDLYNWMDLQDARSVMAAAMAPSTYTFPTQALTPAQVADMGYQNREWFSVDNTGVASGQEITLDDIPGFSSGSASAYNPLPDSPFFNLEIGYLNDEHTSFGLIDFSRKMATDEIPADLANQAPNKYLSSMAEVIEGAQEFDVMDVPWGTDINPNAIENILYLSPTRDSYSRALAGISSGGNLDAVRMVDFDRMYNIFSQSDKRTFLSQAPATGSDGNLKNGLWIQTHYNKLDVDSDFGRGYGGFDIDTWGVTVGYDRRVNDCLLVGAFAGYSDAELDGWQREIESDDLQVGLYAQFLMINDIILSTGFAYGWQSYDLERNIRLGRGFQNNAPIGYNERVKGDFDGNSTQFAVELAKNFDLTDRIFIRPAVGYAYQYVSLDSYKEKSVLQGGNPASLAQRVKSTSHDHRLFRLGTSAGWHNEKLELSARAFWLHNSGDDQPTSFATFTGTNSAEGMQPFAISGAPYSENQAQLGLGIEYRPVNDVPLSFGVQYDALLGDDENEGVRNFV